MWGLSFALQKFLVTEGLVHLGQSITVAIQRGNAACHIGTLLYNSDIEKVFCGVLNTHGIFLFQQKIPQIHTNGTGYHQWMSQGQIPRTSSITFNSLMIQFGLHAIHTGDILAFASSHNDFNPKGVNRYLTLTSSALWETKETLIGDNWFHIILDSISSLYCRF